MWARNYSTAERMHKIILSKGYEDKEAWQMVQKIFDTSDERDDLKRRTEMIISKEEWLNEYGKK